MLGEFQIYYKIWQNDIKRLQCWYFLVAFCYVIIPMIKKEAKNKEKGENGYETKKEGIRSNLTAGDCADCRISVRVRCRREQRENKN